MAPPAPAELGYAIGRALDGIDVVAAFVYGSVAAGTAGPGSDVDTFVLLAADPGEHRPRLRAAFHELQERLGCTPDPEYPVELFAVAAATAALDAVERALAAGTAGALDPTGDEREVVRALTGPRLVLRGAPELDLLTERAERLAERLAAGLAAPAGPRPLPTVEVTP